MIGCSEVQRMPGVAVRLEVGSQVREQEEDPLHVMCVQESRSLGIPEERRDDR